MRNVDSARTRVLVEGTIASAPYMARAAALFEAGLLDESWLTDGASVPSPDRSQPGVTVAGNWWSATDILRIRDELHYKGVLALLDLTAKRAGEWVDKADADAAAKAGPRQLASELSALTKFLDRELGRRDWPILIRKLANTFSYQMSPEVAAIWNS